MGKARRVFQQVEGDVIQKGQFYCDDYDDDSSLRRWNVSEPHRMILGETIWEEVFDE